jgi:hypothetical protein
MLGILLWCYCARNWNLSKIFVKLADVTFVEIDFRVVKEHRELAKPNLNIF